MTAMRPFSILLMTIILTSLSAANADDMDVVIAGCDGCHGENGVSQWNDVPTIAGIDAFVHADALYVYRDEARPCAMSEYRCGAEREPTDMCAITKDLSDDQIEAIAEHYAALPFVPAQQEFDADFAASGKVIHDRDCSRCHSDGGSNPEDEASILAGQWMGYMETICRVCIGRARTNGQNEGQDGPAQRSGRHSSYPLLRQSAVMPNEAKQVMLRDLFAAIDRKDTEAFVEFLTEDAKFRFGSSPPAVGSDAIAKAVGGFFQSIADLKHEIDRTIREGDTLVCEGSVTYTRHDGSTIALPFANVFELADEKIADYKIYMDIGPLHAG